MNEMTIPVVEGSVVFSVETGCAAQQQAQNSDPMLQRIEQPKVHGEVGVVYGQSAR